MTLKRQLLVAISIMFFIVFAGLQSLSVNATKEFLQRQLASHAQDAATSMSSSLGQALEKKDLVLAEIQVALMFDRGYYQKIILFDVNGNQILVKELPKKIGEVPVLFSSLFSLQTPAGEAFISSGWRQLGKVVVVSQPTFAYEYLWSSFKDVAWWMIATYLLALVLTILLLRLILNPLLQIEQTAIEIQNRRFTQISVLPRARELRRVVVAMNAMSRKISETLDVEIAKADAYRKEAYIDKVTKLENRAGFDLRFNQFLSEKGEFSTAALVLLELEDLREFNNKFGYQEGDAVLFGISNVIKDLVATKARFAGRIGGAAFAFVIADVKTETIEIGLNEFHRRISSLFETLSIEKNLNFSIGCVEFTSLQTRAEVFAKADLAIETARQQGADNYVLLNFFDDTSIVTGSSGWRTLIQNALSENRWALFVQPVVCLRDRSIFQHEIFSRLVDHQGNFVSAAKFLPMALRHHLMEDIDKAIVTLIFELLLSPVNRLKDVAVNVSIQSVQSLPFQEWLFEKLERSKVVANKLAFELNEFGYSKDLELTREFVTRLRSFNVRIGIDHFGLDSKSLDALKHVPPDYIKLDGGLVKTILSSEQGRDHLRSIISLAKSLEILVVAQNVESEELATILLEDNVIYGQGYHLGSPEQA